MNECWFLLNVTAMGKPHLYVMPAFLAASSSGFSRALRCSVAFDRSGRIRTTAPSNMISPFSQAALNISSLWEYRCNRQMTSRGLSGSVERGPSARWIRSNDRLGGYCSPSKSRKIASVDSARSSIPVASGSPLRRKLLRLLRSSTSSICNCWERIEEACAVCAASTAANRRSIVATDVSPESMRSDRVCMSCRTAAISCLCDSSSLLRMASMSALVGSACRSALSSASALSVSGACDIDSCESVWNIAGTVLSKFCVAGVGVRAGVV